MKSLAQCKKLIAESEKESYKPTISHWRDIENGMREIEKQRQKRRNQDLLNSYLEKMESTKHTAMFSTPQKMEKVKRAAKLAGVSESQLRDKIERAQKVFLSKIMKNPTTKTTVRKTFVKKTVTKNPSIAARINKLAAGSSLKGELQRINRELTELKREAKGKNANKDYYAPRIRQLESALRQGLAKRNPIKKTVVNPSKALDVLLKKASKKQPALNFSESEWQMITRVYPSYFHVTQTDTNGKYTGGRYYVELADRGKEYKSKNPINPKTIKRANFTNADYKAHQTKTLTELARMFQGGINGDNRRVIESDLTPNGKFRLGHLVQMKVKRNGVIIPIEFDGESFLSADTKKHLWISGKDSMIKNGLSSVGLKKPSKGQLTIIGDLMQIDYVTAKKHIENGQTVRFFHKLGEATGERPKLALDYDGFPIVLGGNYDIWNVGIVN